MSEKAVTKEQLLESARQSEALTMQVARAAQAELAGKADAATAATKSEMQTALAEKKAVGWKPFFAGTSAPSDTNQLWIDINANTGGIKFWNGSAWVAVPVAYT